MRKNRSYIWTKEMDQIILDNQDELSYRLIQEKYFPDIPIFIVKRRANQNLKIKKRRFKTYQYFKKCTVCENEFFVTNNEQSNRKTCSYKCSKIHKRIQNPLEWFIRGKIHRVRSNAKSRGIKFNLNWIDVLNLYNKQNGLCYYTGIKMEIKFEKDKFRCCSPFLLSFDRINSNKPYCIDNIVLCCYSINNLKGEHKEDIIKIFFKQIYNNKGQIYNDIKI